MLNQGISVSEKASHTLDFTKMLHKYMIELQNIKIKVGYPKIEFSNQQQGDHLELVVDGKR